MRYLSLCSGIDAASVAWQPLGWRPVAFAEIEPFPCAVLAHHYPDVPNLGDIRKLDGFALRDMKYGRRPVNVVVGGTPCQDFSIAGKRAGLAGKHSCLALDFAEILYHVRPKWFVWENVPGIFSTAGGRDFGSFIRTLDNIGYSCAWRVLDAQYFGVPQRRRRVYVIGHLGDWRPAAAVLFERDSLRGNTAPRRKAQADVAGTIEASIAASRGEGTTPGTFYYTPRIVGQAMTSKWSKGTSGPAGDEHHNLVCAPLTSRARAGHVWQESRLVVFHGAQDPDVSVEGTPLLGRNRGMEGCFMNASAHVRRLTPLECERLQGFPDHYTAIKFRGKPAADSPRYKALGNAMPVPVMRWIGERINAVEEAHEH